MTKGVKPFHFKTFVTSSKVHHQVVNYLFRMRNSSLRADSQSSCVLETELWGVFRIEECWSARAASTAMFFGSSLRCASQRRTSTPACRLLLTLWRTASSRCPDRLLNAFCWNCDAIVLLILTAGVLFLEFGFRFCFVDCWKISNACCAPPWTGLLRLFCAKRS